MSDSLIPIFDLTQPGQDQALGQLLSQRRAALSLLSPEARTVAEIVQDVHCRGDEAVIDYMRRWTDPDFTADRIRVAPEDLAKADKQLQGELREAIETAIAYVRTYQQHVMPPPEVKTLKLAGAELGLRFVPVDSAALCVPGGTAVLFSTLIMLAVPAIVAGVDPKKLAVLNPPPTRREGEPAGDISPIVLATCHMLGIERIYRIGGAQAVAAAAYGTQSVSSVDMIAGPGNVFVQLAKSCVAGVCGIDGGSYGPSEIVTLADDGADVPCVAADLIAQAEHDPGKCYLVAWQRDVIDRILAEVNKQIPQRKRRVAIMKALRSESCAVLVADQQQGIELVNTIAAEHVNLAVADPRKALEQVRHGGEIFLGAATPVASGDYYAGPSHCLPTGSAARFASGVSVYTFLRRGGTVAYPEGMPADAIRHIAAMAEAEGLDGHAHSVRVRG
ncbi:MAG: histidinol dehydrogenase [Phycisphaeraceae bacterium]|nr:histidinol dehydrogenase [Phycisphaeraceae bacterium]